jgi:hypothetical protein
VVAGRGADGPGEKGGDLSSLPFFLHLQLTVVLSHYISTETRFVTVGVETWGIFRFGCPKNREGKIENDSRGMVDHKTKPKNVHVRRGGVRDKQAWQPRKVQGCDRRRRRRGKGGGGGYVKSESMPWCARRMTCPILIVAVRVASGKEKRERRKRHMMDNVPDFDLPPLPPSPLPNIDESHSPLSLSPPPPYTFPPPCFLPSVPSAHPL